MSMKRSSGSPWRAASIAALFVLSASLGAEAQTLPSGFTDSLVTAVSTPTDLGFLPDGRMLITTQSGTVRVYCPNNSLPGCSSVGAGGGLLPTAAFNPGTVCTDSERGVLGVAVDPNFGAGNTDVFIFYTANKPAGVGCKNRVSRFVYNTANNTFGAETILVDNMLSTAGNHNGGDVKFGKDGYLYISLGDGGCDFNPPNGCQDANFAARNQNVLTGKILRIARDGSIPPTNPWAATGGDCRLPGADGRTTAAQCKETFSWGHRNPFRMAFDPNAAGTRFFINEVGGGAYEEINNGAAGQDFGWSCREGAHTRNTTGPCNPTPPNMVDPIFEYPHATIPGTTITGANCITGGAFVPNGVWPAAYNGTYLVAEYGSGAIFRMTTQPPYTAVDFGKNFGGNSISSLRFGPYLSTQALYYANHGAGQVRRIVNTAPIPPTAVASSDIPGGPTPPVLVTFSGAGSSDAGGLPLTYNWTFGDGATAPNGGVSVQHTYGSLGVFTASLQVTNGTLTSEPATVVIQVGTPPPGTFYSVTPCRIVDTRGTAGVPIKGPKLTSGATQAFGLVNQCGLPTGVKAVALNVTVVSPSQAGDLRIFPTGSTATTSAINFGLGQTRANNLTVKLSAGGQVSVTCAMATAGSTDFLLDVVGYYE